MVRGADALAVDLRFLREEDSVAWYLPLPYHMGVPLGVADTPHEVVDPPPLPYLNQVCTNSGPY